MNILETHELKKIYGEGETAVHALDGVDFTVRRGEFVAIVGRSGSGKSTLLHMRGGLDRPSSGSVTVDGRDIFSLKDEALTISQAARAFNVSINTVRRRIDSGEVAAVKMRNKNYVMRSEVAAALAPKPVIPATMAASGAQYPAVSQERLDRLAALLGGR